jgi:hypothetical protein
LGSPETNQSVLRAARSATELQTDVSPMYARDAGSALVQNTSTPLHPQRSLGDINLSPLPYYPPSPWGAYSPWMPQPPYTYYPHSPVSPMPYQGDVLPNVARVVSPEQGMMQPGIPGLTTPARRPVNQLMGTPTGSNSSVNSRQGNGIALALDGSVNLSSPRWDLSPVVVEEVNSAGGVSTDSLQDYLDRSVTNFQELIRAKPEFEVLEEALAGATLEFQVRYLGELPGGIKTC